jgi:small subunit ribosomal protein S6
LRGKGQYSKGGVLFMHKYELGIILHPHLEEEAIKAEHDLILELIGRFGGVVDKIDNWGKRKLAYEIQKVTEGHYCFIYIDAPPELPKELEERLRIRENLMRFMLIRRDDIA